MDSISIQVSPRAVHDKLEPGLQRYQLSSFHCIFTVTHCSLSTMLLLSYLLTLAPGSLALTIPSMGDERLVPRNAEGNLLSRQSTSATNCTNSATNRGCWGAYSIDTNYYVSSHPCGGYQPAPPRA